MAKRKRKSTRRRAAPRKSSPRRRAPARAAAPTRRRRRSSSGGGGMRMMPSKDHLVSWGMAAGYGFLESAAKGDDAHLLNKVPKFIPQVGYTGNIAANAWVLGTVLKNRHLRRFGDSVAHVAAYQLGTRGALFTEASEHFTVSGPGEVLDVSPHEMEALADAMSDADLSGDEDLSGDDEFDVSGDEEFVE